MSHMDNILDARPGTAGVRVTDFGWQGLLNPNPLNRDDDEGLVDDYLSPAKLRALTGEENLTEVRTLQICLNTGEHSLGNFGSYMPNLRQLKLNNSLILSVRDLGTSLSHLEVLWMVRCGITDLDGIASLCALKELYLAFNNLNDLSQVSMLEHLEILDLEGNNLDHIRELQYLALCTNLTTLTLEGNPICVRPNLQVTDVQDYNYRKVVKNIIPHLQILDDVPIDQLKPVSPVTPNYDWQMVTDGIKENFASPSDTRSGHDISSWKTSIRPSTAQLNVRPSTAQTAIHRRPYSAPRPTSAGRPVTSHQRAGSSPFSEPIKDSIVEDEASDLTHGVGRVICGNPIKALRARKEKLGPTTAIPLQQPGYKSEHTYHAEATSDSNRDDVLAELRAWREKHRIQLQKIQEEGAPQILKISYSDEEEEDCSSSDDAEDSEELKESWDLTCLVRVTPDISSPSPQSPTGVVQAGAMYPGEISDAKYKPSPPISPCPPSSGMGHQKPNKGSDLRARRMLRETNQSGSRSPRQTVLDSSVGDEVFSLMEVEGNNSTVPYALQLNDDRSSDLGIRPFSGSAQTSSSSSRPSLDRYSPKQIHFHQPVIRSSMKTPSPPQITRSIAAKEILHRLPNRPTLLLGNKGSSS
ncbi:leucine-rich repeat-containing 56 isoform X1 [Pelobates cultripes]|uniref:Leucine-rich repeat-containing 56 isoform X1 n=1 Tax=Pelobates cultripes TaxID=61616 RepID=A0AAD1WRD6_PELCU|nr:leucine-rich repeat-containing 56 isoform X1 [Pelobates cultripes]